MDPETTRVTTRRVNDIDTVPAGARAEVPVGGNYESITRVVALPAFVTTFPETNTRRTREPAPAPVIAENIAEVSVFISLRATLPVSTTAVTAGDATEKPPTPPDTLRTGPAMVDRGGADNKRYGTWPVTATVTKPLVTSTERPAIC